MFDHAVVLFAQKPSSKDCIKFFDDFLAVAPVDHPKVPACHYLKAEYFRRDDKNLSRAFYEAGLAAEKKQLPCFLPYSFERKELLKAEYVLQDYFKSPSKIMNLVIPATGW
uniref:Uncharacterized protein n=1 Tax=Panagrolaimus sp. PS1159 TaxID=55785 RepID=A0AC35GYU6_9BILA